MAKLTWEWSDTDRNIITIRKARGKITMEEIIQYMHEPAQLHFFDGKLVLAMFRVNESADLYPYGWEEQTGDAQDLYVIEDETRCPICNQVLYLQYCPDCGRKLYGDKEG